jgi:hypothetical protein
MLDCPQAKLMKKSKIFLSKWPFVPNVCEIFFEQNRLSYEPKASTSRRENWHSYLCRNQLPKVIFSIIFDYNRGPELR